MPEFSTDDLPDWLPEFERLDAYWGEVDRAWAPDFKMAPDILVIHSAASGNWPAEYLHDPVCDAGEGHLCSDGKTRAVAAAHFCFYQGLKQKLRPGTAAPKMPMRFVQCASLKHTAPHVGGSTCLDDQHPNRRSIGIELPAKINARALFEILLDRLLVALPSLKHWTMHKTIDDKRQQTDPVPGSGFVSSWLEHTRLTFVGRGKVAP